MASRQIYQKLQRLCAHSPSFYALQTRVTHQNSRFLRKKPPDIRHLNSLPQARSLTGMNSFKLQVDKWLERDKESIVDLVSALVRCKTPSPPGDTRQAMSLVKEFLVLHQKSFKEITSVDSMPNLISTVEMSGQGRHLIFNGHLDVLPAGDEPGWKDDPWSGKVSDGRVWGRGASDMKAGVAAMLFAYFYLGSVQADLSGRVSIVLASDEETGLGRGTGYVFAQVESDMIADCVLSAEPSGVNAITFSSKGYLHFTVKVATRGSISGYPNASPSAIHIAMDIVRDLKVLEEMTVDLPASIADRLANPEFRIWLDSTYGEGMADVIPAVSVNVGVIQGGCSASVIAPNCEFEVTVVMPVGLDPHAVFDKASEIVALYPEAQIFLEGADAADISDPEHEMASILKKTVTDLGWDEPQLVPDVAISDLRYWRYRGIPGFWYGPDGADVSAANESADIEEILHIIRAYTLASFEYLSR